VRLAVQSAGREERQVIVKVRTEWPIGEEIGRWSIAEHVRGTPSSGQYLASDDEIRGASLLVTLGPEQTRPTAELLRAFELKVSGVGPLRGVYGLVDRGGAVYHGLVERVPEGEPLSARPWPIDLAVAAPFALQLARLVERAAGARVALGGLRPQLIWVEDRAGKLALDGACPRAELFMQSARRPGGTSASLFDDFYFAPELLDGSPPSAAGDVFSACACIAHVLSGAHPFDGDNAARQLLAIGTGRRRAWTGPAAIKPILDAGLAVLPDARPSPAELVAALAGVK
jgi:hypothetical protein